MTGDRQAVPFGSSVAMCFNETVGFHRYIMTDPTDGPAPAWETCRASLSEASIQRGIRENAPNHAESPSPATWHSQTRTARSTEILNPSGRRADPDE